LSPAGSDWLPAAAEPATSAVLPGIPGAAGDVHLVGFATGSNDVDLKVQLLTPSGPITPAGNETLHLKSGVTSAINLPKLTQGQGGSLLLTPSDPGDAEPFVAALRFTLSKNHSTDIAYIPTTDPVGPRASAADNHSTKGSSILLAATTSSAVVKVTTSASTKGGSPVSTTVTIPANSTKLVTPHAPGRSGPFAITVEPISGGPVYAARELTQDINGVPGVTVQTLPDDGGYVDVPDAGQDLSVLEP
jgi:hypothetical protein